MCNASNYYHILDKIIVNFSPIKNTSKVKKFHLSLDNFIDYCNNDEISRLFTYKVDFSLLSFNGSQTNQPKIKIVLFSCDIIDRESIERVIACNIDYQKESIELIMEDMSVEKNISLNLHKKEDQDVHKVLIYDLDFFLDNVGQTVSISNHWAKAILFDAEHNQCLVPDDSYMQKFSMKPESPSFAP